VKRVRFEFLLNLTAVFLWILCELVYFILCEINWHVRSRTYVKFSPQPEVSAGEPMDVS
jgi:hypothetical protein